jgi:hypothetical protein
MQNFHNELDQLSFLEHFIFNFGEKQDKYFEKFELANCIELGQVTQIFKLSWMHTCGKCFLFSVQAGLQVYAL